MKKNCKFLKILRFTTFKALQYQDFSKKKFNLHIVFNIQILNVYEKKIKNLNLTSNL